MENYFHGWRRKAGFVSLIVSCLIGATWSRSIRFDDTLTISTEASSYLQLVSAAEHLTVVESSIETCCNSPFLARTWTSREGNRQCWLWEIADLATYVDINLHGFWMEEGRLGGGKTRIAYWSMQIPYWTVIIPPTLFALYLLLWSVPRKPVKPAPQLTETLNADVVTTTSQSEPVRGH